MIAQIPHAVAKKRVNKEDRTNAEMLNAPVTGNCLSNDSMVIAIAKAMNSSVAPVLRPESIAREIVQEAIYGAHANMACAMTSIEPPRKLVIARRDG
jgi:hypothetical protein